jgi:hypothetical protein
LSKWRQSNASRDNASLPKVPRVFSGEEARLEPELEGLVTEREGQKNDAMRPGWAIIRRNETEKMLKQ